MSPVALVTGGAVRVGRAITLGLAEAGWDVAVNFHASDDDAREVAALVEEGGRRALLVPGDVSDASAVDGIVQAVEEGFGRLDLLVNNAALFESAELLEVDEAAWDRVLGVNLKGPFLLVRRAAPLLRAARGSVINVLDLSAFRPWRLYPHHAVSKAGLLHLTRVMARSLAPEIRVNAVAPGTVLPPEDASEEEVARDRARSVLDVEGAPEDVVRTVLFLAGSPFITGEVIVVDGGERLR